jgi:hypothetical protein
LSPAPQLWIRFLSRFAPVVALTALCLVVVFIGGVGFTEADNAQGAAYSELLGAARSPSAYQLAMVFDALGWLVIGVSLIAFSRMVAEAAPVRSTFIFVAGVGHLLGFLGGILRMSAVHEIAVLYASTSDPGAQAALRSTFLSANGVVGALFLAGDVMAALGWLLVGYCLLTTKVLPRWVALWTLSSGFVVALFTPLSAAYGAGAFPILLIYILSGVIAFHLVFAVKFWRVEPSPTSAPAA